MLYSPVTWEGAIYEFLLPETIILLMQDDLRVSRPDCLRVLRESCKASVCDVIPTSFCGLHLILLSQNAQEPSLEPLTVKQEPVDEPQIVSLEKGKQRAHPPSSADIIDLTLSDSE